MPTGKYAGIYHDIETDTAIKLNIFIFFFVQLFEGFLDALFHHVELRVQLLLTQVHYGISIFNLLLLMFILRIVNSPDADFVLLIKN
jgi:hypothetical protein